jgi:AhpD family alkylhydroperoxidase
LETYREMLGELREPTRALRRQIPAAFDGFAELHASAVADGCIPGRLKELIAVAIAVADGCDGCIAYHARAAARKGATSEELGEVLAVALLMAGGPASIYGPRAWAAFHEFAGAEPAQGSEGPSSEPPARASGEAPDGRESGPER